MNAPILAGKLFGLPLHFFSHLFCNRVACRYIKQADPSALLSFSCFVIAEKTAVTRLNSFAALCLALSGGQADGHTRRKLVCPGGRVLTIDTQSGVHLLIR